MFQTLFQESMYNGIDAYGVDKQPVRNHNPWMLLYFISFLLIIAFFVLNMFVGVVVENFHRCRQEFDLSDTVRAWAKDQNNSNSGAIQIKISDSEGKVPFSASLEN